jgi:hypothetical protein
MHQPISFLQNDWFSISKLEESNKKSKLTILVHFPQKVTHFDATLLDVQGVAFLVMPSLFLQMAQTDHIIL